MPAHQAAPVDSVGGANVDAKTLNPCRCDVRRSNEAPRGCCQLLHERMLLATAVLKAEQRTRDVSGNDKHCGAGGSDVQPFQTQSCGLDTNVSGLESTREPFLQVLVFFLRQRSWLETKSKTYSDFSSKVMENIHIYLLNCILFVNWVMFTHT